MKKHEASFDLLLYADLVSHDVNPYLNLLISDGTMVMTGAIEAMDAIHGGNFVL